MVDSKWMENALIEIESARYKKNWSKKQENQFKNLLKIYHTGQYRKKSRKEIKQLLQ